MWCHAILGEKANLLAMQQHCSMLPNGWSLTINSVPVLRPLFTVFQLPSRPRSAPAVVFAGHMLAASQLSIRNGPVTPKLNSHVPVVPQPLIRQPPYHPIMSQPINSHCHYPCNHFLFPNHMHSYLPQSYFPSRTIPLRGP